VLYGGAGSDALNGGSGADVFAWRLADHGSFGAPDVDTIADFNNLAAASGGDVLDLRDLLIGASHTGTDPGNLANYLDFAVSGSGASATTTIHISSTGQFAGGVYSAGNEDQSIVLQNFDIRSQLGLGGAANDSQIIQELLNRGKLIADGP